jgi:hypothetical protein
MFQALLEGEPVIGPYLAALITALNAHGWEVTGGVYGARASGDAVGGSGLGAGADVLMFVDPVRMTISPDVVPFAEADLGFAVGVGASLILGLRLSPRRRSGDPRSSYEGGSFGASLSTAVAGGGFSVGQSLLHGEEGWIVAAYGVSEGTPGAMISYSYGFSALRTGLRETLGRLQRLPADFATDTHLR